MKNLPANALGIRHASLIRGSGRSPEGGMAVYSSILAWRIPWTEEPGRLQPMGSERVRHDLVTQKQQMRKKRSGGSGKSVGENAGF